MLNRSRGPAVFASTMIVLALFFLTRVFQGPRALLDRKLYKENMQKILHSYPNLSIRSGSVHDLVLDQSTKVKRSRKSLVAVSGVRLGM